MREVPKNYDDKMSFFETIINQEGQQYIQLNSIGLPVPSREPCIFGTITDLVGNKNFLRIPVSAIEVVTKGAF